MDLNALREFCAVVSEGSFVAAARKLDTPKSTVSKRVQDLETALGVQLIERTTRRLSLTAEGALVLSKAERILSDADELRLSLKEPDERVNGHLRVAAPSLFGQCYLGRIAARSRQSYPDLTLEFVLTDSQPDLVEEGFDAAIRASTPFDSPLVSKPFAISRRIAVAAPTLMNEPLHHPQDLTDYPALLDGVGLIQTWYFTDGEQETSARVAGGLAVTSLPVLRDAARDGCGVALLPESMVQDDLTCGRLIDAVPGWTSLPTVFSLIYPSPQALTSRLRAFLDLLSSEFLEREPG
ncbi:LysR family transcriptional regulator [Qingshengfaniella alkalisoli]|nr:LysR family transcriptional regulator [Qingshengfaniella alkalisoli]